MIQSIGVTALGDLHDTCVCVGGGVSEPYAHVGA